MSGVGGPCGACKFLRRKCVKGCIFAPYFESDQLGTAHFAAVHKVFGASNASKMLMAIPANRRLEAVVTLCYEALARVRDPVYGCVGHIFTLQQQVVNLQAELAYVQARLSTLQHLPLTAPPPGSLPLGDTNVDLQSSCEAGHSSDVSLYVNPPPPLLSPGLDITGLCSELDEDVATSDLHMLAWEFVSRHLPGVRFRPSQ
nr:LOB domain-containing protein 19-like [Ipomoea trifida]